ncbi:hypothetical protein MW887_005674 [Aspergillus wentii]|nr:hypothetical protein MW887_005674 [Aspergillus wentii]
MASTFFVPDCPEACRELIKKFAPKTALHKLEKMFSGSKVSHEQFSLLRVYFPQILEPLEFLTFKDKYGLASVWGDAQAILKQSDSFNAMLRCIRSEHPNFDCIPRSGPDCPGEFIPFLTFLGEISRSDARPVDQIPDTNARDLPRGNRSTRATAINVWEDSDNEEHADEPTVHVPKKRKLPTAPRTKKKSDKKLFSDAEYEITVNAASGILLRMVGDLIPNTRSHWVLDHVTLRASFSNASYTAVTDGALWTKMKRVIQSIVEVKRASRWNILNDVRMQEGGEGASWIFCADETGLPALNGHRLLVSMDRDQMFLTFLMPGQGYKEYLKTGVDGPTAFLEMRTYGPFDLCDAEEMEAVSIALVACSILACQAAEAARLLEANLHV